MKPESRYFLLSTVVCNIIVYSSQKSEWQKLVPYGNPDAHTKNNIVFHLFTRETRNAPRRIFPNSPESLLRSPWRPYRPTKFITHGFLMKQEKGSGGYLLKDALLHVGDFNVILVDWSTLDRSPRSPRWYLDAVNVSVPLVGLELGRMTELLVAAGTSPEDLHLIGHSLGAHISGVAGRRLLGPLRAGRITGLDPAGPRFEGDDAGPRRLDPSDAGFVEVVHTDGGVLGIMKAVGHVDFRPGGGLHAQPGCGADPVGLCSHCFAWEIYQQAVLRPGSIEGVQCGSYDDFTRSLCWDGRTAQLGPLADTRARGNFYMHLNLTPSTHIQRKSSAAGLLELTTHVVTEGTAGRPMDSHC